MSRVGKKPISIPKGIEVKIEGQKVIVKGAKGQLEYICHDLLTVKNENQSLIVSLKKASDHRRLKRKVSAEVLLGTERAHLNNLIMGAKEGYSKKMLLTGVGYRAQAQGKKLNLSLGFSHPVALDMPAGITVETPSQTEIIIHGMDKQLVGKMADRIRRIRPVEPYKGKGVRYSDEIVILKEVKKKQ